MWFSDGMEGKGERGILDVAVVAVVAMVLVCECPKSLGLLSSLDSCGSGSSGESCGRICTCRLDRGQGLASGG